MAHCAGVVKKRTEPLPDPPPIRGLVVDGSNVIASGALYTLARLDAALAWCAAWRADLPCIAFLDASTARRLRPETQDTLRARCANATPGRARHVVCPRDEPADPYLLAHAREHGALVVSNDRYFDYEELRAGVITLQFRFRDGAFEPFAEATCSVRPAARSASRCRRWPRRRAGERGGQCRRSAWTAPRRAARQAGHAPPTRPSATANRTAVSSTVGITRNANATSVNVWKFVVPVLHPVQRQHDQAARRRRRAWPSTTASKRNDRKIENGRKPSDDQDPDLVRPGRERGEHRVRPREDRGDAHHHARGRRRGR